MLLRGGYLCKQRLHASDILLRQAPTAGLCRLILQQHVLGRINCGSPDQFLLEDGYPHLEVFGEVKQHMFLRGEQPEKITGADLVLAVAKQVSSRSSRDEVQLEFGVMMPGVGNDWVVITPDVSV